MAGGNAANKKKSEGAVIVDISGDANAQDAKGKKSKKNKKEKRKGGKLKLLIILLVFFFAVASAGFVIFRGDHFGVRTAFYEFAHGLDPDYKGITSREAQLADREALLDEREAALIAEQERLTAVSEQLEAQEEYLVSLENTRVPVYRPPVNEEDRVYMTNIGKIYAAMEPVNAAAIMVRLYTTEDMAAIIYYMKQANAAAVLEQMDPYIAAEITDQLLNN